MFANSVITGYSDVWESMGESTNIRVVAYGPYGQQETMTGDGGQFVISGLGNGTYMLDFIKEGFGTIRKHSIQLFGNDTAHVGQVFLFKKYDNFVLPDFVKISTGLIWNSHAVILETSMTAANGGIIPFIPVVIYLDSLKTVSWQNFSMVYPNVEATYPPSGGEKLIFYIRTDYLQYKSGTEVFFIAYVANPNEIYNGYFDKYLGIEQLSTLLPEKHSEVMSFIMP